MFKQMEQRVRMLEQQVATATAALAAATAAVDTASVAASKAAASAAATEASAAAAAAAATAATSQQFQLGTMSNAASANTSPMRGVPGMPDSFANIFGGNFGAQQGQAGAPRSGSPQRPGAMGADETARVRVS